MQRLDKSHSLHIHRTYLLALRLDALLCNEFFRIDKLRLPMLMLSAECYLELRVLVITYRNKI